MMAAAAQLTDEDATGRLRRIALSLGADVPFFLDPRPSRVTGIGERIAAMEDVPSLPIVIAVPPFVVGWWPAASASCAGLAAVVRV